VRKILPTAQGPAIRRTIPSVSLNEESMPLVQGMRGSARPSRWTFRVKEWLDGTGGIHLVNRGIETLARSLRLQTPRSASAFVPHETPCPNGVTPHAQGYEWCPRVEGRRECAHSWFTAEGDDVR
jgi:hypothetical protein